MIVLLVVLAPLRTKPLICNRVLGRIGVLSYSIYLLHVPLLMFGFGWFRQTGVVPTQGWSGPTIGVTLLLAVACLALATLTYTTIERPFLVRKARLDS
jgi:peptidoglycan/LPS O-acetylase OafA/YrhL